MKISACVIVKNEEGNIGTWLECVRQFADELIVVDTGSTDQTVSLAVAGGAQVFSYVWDNDFSAAKNYALDQAHGNWIVFLDADEYFSAVSIPKIRGIIQHFEPDRKVAGLMCRLINIDKDRENRVSGSIVQVRIFRNLKSFRYVGKIHETLQNANQSQRSLQMVRDLTIYHTGYSSNIIRKKLERNLTSLQAKIKRQGKEMPEDYFYLMDCYYGLENYALAEQYARLAVQSKVKFIGMENHPYEGWIASLLKMQRPVDEILDVMDAAIAAFPAEQEFILMKGTFLWEQGDYLTAGNMLKAALAEKENPKQNNPLPIALTATSQLEALWPKVYRYLGTLERMQFHSAAASQLLLAGIRAYPYDIPLFCDFYRSIRQAAPAEIIEILNMLYETKEDAAFLVRALQGLNAGSVYIYYARKADRYLLQGTAAYLAAGKYEAALAAGSKELSSLYRMIVRVGIAQAKQPEESMLTMLLPPQYRQQWQKGIYPLVSIMIPTYNRPKFFELTLRSACAQTYPNLEIIVCDNSTDERTAKVMEKYRRDERIRYVRNAAAKSKAENFVPFETLAHGEYLQWLMDDDILVKDKLVKMMQCFQKNPNVTMVTSERGCIDGNGQVIASLYKDLFPGEGEYVILDGRETGRATLLKSQNFLGEPSAVLFRRKDLQHHYWRAECRGYKTISDIAMWLELLEKGHCGYFRQPLSYYRRHAEQEGQNPDVVLLSRLEWCRMLSEYYERKVFVENESEYRQALQRIYDEYLDLCRLPQDTPLSMWDEYEKCMKKIGCFLGQECQSDAKQ